MPDGRQRQRRIVSRRQPQGTELARRTLGNQSTAAVAYEMMHPWAPVQLFSSTS